MTTMVPVKGVKRFRDRHGKWRCYHRKSGVPIASEFGTAAFFNELAALDAGMEIREPTPGSLGMLIEAYRAAPAFLDRAEATKAGYLRYLGLVKALHGMPLVQIDAPFLAALRDKLAVKRGRRTANYVLAMFSIVFEFAIERGWADKNPAKNVKRARRESGRPKANRPWSLEERRTVLDAASWALKVPIALAMFTGLRKGDVIGMTKAAIRGDTLVTSKTGEEVYLALHADLADVLRRAPAHNAITIAATSRGTPWTITGFNTSFGRTISRLLRAGKVGPGLTFHGLRHTVGTLLAEAGTGIDDIRRVLGQKTLAMAQHYSERASKGEATRGMVHRLDPLGSKLKTGTELSTLPQKTCQT